MRQSQTFPDVLLRRASDGDILLGLELKGWYLLAKEGEPSYRYTVTPAASNLQDMIVVVPWVLSQVISGTPVAFAPYLESARYAAEYRNFWWEHIRESSTDKSIRLAGGVAPYPAKSNKTNDVPASDSGGNFGRYARTGIMDDYKREMRLELCGVRIECWLAFFKTFQDDAGEAKTRRQIETLARRIQGSGTDPTATNSSFLAILSELDKMVGPGPLVSSPTSGSPPSGSGGGS